MTPSSCIRLLRPLQWVKNLMMLFPPFLAGTLFRDGSLKVGLLPLTSLCVAASTVYVFNDILDREKDRAHPRKKQRPVASGRVSVRQASIISACLLVMLIVLSLLQPLEQRLYLLAYMIISAAYTLALRNIPVVDLFCIAAGFLVRLQYGGAVFGVSISEWLFLSVLFLALFLSAGKRLNEQITLDSRAHEHRRSLLSYPEGFLQGVMFMTGASALVTYSMYVVSKQALVYTVPLCCFGLFRFLQRAMAGRGGDPTESLLKDPMIFTVGVIWTLMVGWGIYR